MRWANRIHWTVEGRGEGPFWTEPGDLVKPSELLLQEVLWASEPVGSGCIEWRGSLNHGYGIVVVAMRPFANGNRKPLWRRAHRVAWELANGKRPALTLDHLCMNKSCVCLAHLEEVSIAENVRRANRVYGLKTHCKRGHAYDAENTHVDAYGKRFCRACHRIVARESARARRARGRAS